MKSSKRIWATLRASAAGLAVLAVHAGAPAAEPVAIRDLFPQSLALSPDGHHLVVGRQLYRAYESTYELLLVNLSSGATQIVEEKMHNGSAWSMPVWSPDGSGFAYYVNIGEQTHVRVWGMLEGKILATSQGDLCGTQPCVLSSVVWSADSQRVTYVREDARANNRMERVGGSRAELVESELMGLDRSPGGVAMAVSAAAKPLLDDRPWLQDVHLIEGREIPNQNTNRAVIAMDARTGQESVLAEGHYFVAVTRPSSSDRIYAVTGETASDNARYYSMVALESRTPPSTLPAVAEWSDNTNSQPRISYSGTGGRVALMTTASARPATIRVVDMRSGTLVREIDIKPCLGALLKQRVPLILQELFFVWLDERSLALVAPNAAVGDMSARPLKRELKLWHISVDSGDIAPVAVAKGLELETAAICNDTGQPCLTGRNGEIVGRAAFEGKQRALIALNPVNGRHRVIAAVPQPDSPRTDTRETKSAYFDFQHNRTIVTTPGGRVAYLEEGSAVAPNLWSIHVDVSARTKALKVLNPGKVELWRSIPLAWTNSEQQDVKASLTLPHGAQPGRRLPVVTVVYQSGKGRYAGLRFHGGPAPWFDRFRTQGQYAVLNVSQIESIVPQGPRDAFYRPLGKDGLCNFLNENALAALDAAIRTGWVDADRVGIFGHSAGGYFVNCVITKTDRFKAAISGAGISSYPSGYGFQPGDGYVGGSLWKVPERYITESPLFQADKIHTPLLLYYGKRDLYMSQQSREMFYGLRMLNSPVALLAFDDVDHSDMHGRDDFWRIAIDWFDRILRPAVPAKTQ